MKPKTKIKKIAGLILASIMLSSCLTVQTAYDFDKSIDFSSLKTYAFHEQALASLSVNSLDKPRLIGAVTNAMKNIGFSRSGRPDILVGIHVLEKDATKTGAGWVGGGYVYDYTALEFRWTTPQWNRDATVKHVTESTIVIDFVNPNTNTLIWHGRFNGFDSDDFKLREKRIQAAVNKILAQYPPNASM